MPTDPFAANPRVAHRDNRLEFCSLENAENTNPGLPVNPSPPSPNTDTNLIVTASRDSAESARPHESVARTTSELVLSWLTLPVAASNASDAVTAFPPRRSTGDVANYALPIPGSLNENGEYEVQHLQLHAPSFEVQYVRDD